MEECVNKDESNNHSIALSGWIAPFTPHLHVSPLAVLVKPTKKTHLLFDAPAQPHPDVPALNDFVDMTGKWFIGYGTADMMYYKWLRNLRISYLDKPIFQFFDDIARAFKHVTLHPDVVGAHAAQTPDSKLLIMNLKAIFGSQPSPVEFMISSDCRAAMATFLQSDLVKGPLDQPYPCEAAIPYMLPTPADSNSSEQRQMT